MMYNYGYGYDAGFGVFGIIWHLFWVVLGIALIVWLVRAIFGCRRHGNHCGGKWRDVWEAHSGLTILNERFAKGEITKEEYEERKKVLLGE